MIVYKCTNLINNKTYIGLTVKDLEKRKQEHFNSAFNTNGNTVFYRALRKYGEKNFNWEIIDTAETESELKCKEKYWIDYYNSFIGYKNPLGYNMTLGGDGALGYSHADGHNKGSKNNNTELSEDDVIRIKNYIKEETYTQYEIAEMFNVTNSAISSIKKGRSWVNVGENVSELGYWNNKKLTELDVLEIKELIKLGVDNKDIVKKFNITNLTVRNIKTGKTWSKVGEDVSNFHIRKGNTKLSEEDVKGIKNLLDNEKMSFKLIAIKYGVHVQTIRNIHTGKVWKSIC